MLHILGVSGSDLYPRFLVCFLRISVLEIGHDHFLSKSFLSNLLIILLYYNIIFPSPFSLLSVCLAVPLFPMYEGVSKSFRTGRLLRELQMIQLSATRCSYIAILWVSLVSFATITLFVASLRVFIVVSIYFFIDSVRKLLDTPLYFSFPYPCYLTCQFVTSQIWLF
jgi:hypothetical protein